MICQKLGSHGAEVLAGKEVHYKVQSQQPGGGIEHCAVTLLPYPPGAARPAGFVESDDALAKLREAGVDYAQGFGIGRGRSRNCRKNGDW